MEDKVCEQSPQSCHSRSLLHFVTKFTATASFGSFYYDLLKGISWKKWSETS